MYIVYALEQPLVVDTAEVDDMAQLEIVRIWDTNK